VDGLAEQALVSIELLSPPMVRSNDLVPFFFESHMPTGMLLLAQPLPGPSNIILQGSQV